MSEELRRRVLDVALRRLRRTRDSRWAWQHLYNCLWPFVNSITRATTNDPALAEDAAQEVFVRLAKYAPFAKFTRPEMFQSYVAVIAMNAGHDQNRRQARRAEHEEPLTDDVANRAADTGGDPQHEAELRDLAAWVIGRLTAEERRLMGEMLRGTSLKVLANQYDAKYSTVAVRLSRLRRKVVLLFAGSSKKSR